MRKPISRPVVNLKEKDNVALPEEYRKKHKISRNYWAKILSIWNENIKYANVLIISKDVVYCNKIPIDQLTFHSRNRKNSTRIL